MTRTRPPRTQWSAATLLCLAGMLGCGCSRYGEFRLPAPSGVGTSPQGLPIQALPHPVLGRGEAGEWDAVDVLNPAIVRREGGYWNFYSGFDGKTWRTGLALSSDGVDWRKQGMVLGPDGATWEGDYLAANGSALLENDQFYYWYQAGSTPSGRLEDPAPRVGLARSYDGRQWVKQPRPVLEPGPWMSWDERGVADPFVVHLHNRFFLYYLGQDRARRQRLGVAVSTDGVHWTKLRDNPILQLGAPGSFDENGLGEPAVWSSSGFYWMLYTGRDAKEVRRLGLAKSVDGVTWSKVGPPPLEGQAEWDSRVICDPDVALMPEGIRVWFGGGDVATPAERLNGQIGVAWLRRRP